MVFPAQAPIPIQASGPRGTAAWPLNKEALTAGRVEEARAGEGKAQGSGGGWVAAGHHCPWERLEGMGHGTGGHL